jgi:F-type H+-transporting ATPase subunit b
VKKNFKRTAFLLLVLALSLAVTQTTRAQTTHPEEKTSSNSIERSEAAQEQQNETSAYRHSAAVQAAGRKLGLQPEGAARLFEFINFAVLAIGILWLLVKKLPQILRARSERIARELVDARSMTDDANQRLGAVEQRLSRLDQEIASIRAQSEAEIRRDEALMKDQLDREKVKIIAEAEQEIASASAHAQRNLKQYAAVLAVEQAARSLNLTADADRALVANFAAGLGSKREQN